MNMMSATTINSTYEHPLFADAFVVTFNCPMGLGKSFLARAMPNHFIDIDEFYTEIINELRPLRPPDRESGDWDNHNKRLYEYTARRLRQIYLDGNKGKIIYLLTHSSAFANIFPTLVLDSFSVKAHLDVHFNAVRRRATRSKMPIDYDYALVLSNWMATEPDNLFATQQQAQDFIVHKVREIELKTGRAAAKLPRFKHQDRFANTRVRGPNVPVNNKMTSRWSSERRFCTSMWLSRTKQLMARRYESSITPSNARFMDSMFRAWLLATADLWRDAPFFGLTIFRIFSEGDFNLYVDAFSN
jgi:hypothetical protein